MSNPEHYDQVNVIREVDRFCQLARRDLLINGQAPVFAVPNAAKRTAQQAGYMIAEGLRSGVPDLLCPVASGGFNGLAIEMKHGKNKATDNQLLWIAALKRFDWRVEVCYSAGEAIEIFINHLRAAVVNKGENE